MMFDEDYYKHPPTVENARDWRGTPILIGSHVVYHAQTKGGKTVEGIVKAITEGDQFRGLTIMVAPLQESGIAVARPPFAYPRVDSKLFAVPQLNVTVLGE